MKKIRPCRGEKSVVANLRKISCLFFSSPTLHTCLSFIFYISPTRKNSPHESITLAMIRLFFAATTNRIHAPRTLINAPELFVFCVTWLEWIKVSDDGMETLFTLAKLGILFKRCAKRMIVHSELTKNGSRFFFFFSLLMLIPF